ncbi:DUF2309 domain-containing protein [Flavihumibacter profundi]|uniref:DUF2309 domain-containing protein n=1 Tax=Flavihumibacter profundi TaxID=2716883 RepID=UPI001CC3CA57|nr:DUF2309 domain-containing protein [Flavihumibacter profundi]MBZ5857694.1 DUF2309 domain-containing protein [Flavihumibacter profundi]
MVELLQEPILIHKRKKKIDIAIEQSWSKIAPFWPLKNLIAVNPLAGFEDLPFEEALTKGKAYFQEADLPLPMQSVNRETIKWLQAFFDEGQAVIGMPMRQNGLFQAVRHLLPYDNRLWPKDNKILTWLNHLPEDPLEVIPDCLNFLEITGEQQEKFLSLLLTTLPGWAAHIQYRTSWASGADLKHNYPVQKADYLALRLLLTCLLWPSAKELLGWHEQALKKAGTKSLVSNMHKAERLYRQSLLQKLTTQSLQQSEEPDAQLVFCIDVRSEPFRRAIEAQGRYETFGFAGFFGVPVSIENDITGESHSSCPVLLQPAHHVTEYPLCNRDSLKKEHRKWQSFQKLYQSLKYNFTTPFALAEALGLASGLSMLKRSLWPGKRLSVPHSHDWKPNLDSISYEQQCNYAVNALRMMGLTSHFAPLVVLCGHGSQTQNNAYATALDCGACGGRHGAPNARILAAILNNVAVRLHLKQQGIHIPTLTHFIAAEHNTTTDEVALYTAEVPGEVMPYIEALTTDLQKARLQNSQWRSAELGLELDEQKAKKHTATRARDWAQVRPEWGLARNACFIVGPRTLTKQINLGGRSFLHSYDWKQDNDGSSLTSILTAPMVVAQWINSQYLFSTLDNTAFGSGSKITKNITGKIGIMQGNASDLMHGLPLQSVYMNDREPYHEALRLLTVVYAPLKRIDAIISAQNILQKLFGNGWVTLACIDPETHEPYILQRDLQWFKA